LAEEICEMLGVGRYTLYRYLGQRDRNASEKRKGCRVVHWGSRVKRW
jgi:predicted DNA-binding transcriptional regulator AlpA